MLFFGVLEGKYDPLEFRFFVGCHEYEESTLDVKVHLGKYQPIACARSLALKQCISLPKPLWHEGKAQETSRFWLVVSGMSCWLKLVFLCLVFRCNSLHHLLVMELCGGDLSDLSSLELMKRDDHQFQVVDETEYFH